MLLVLLVLLFLLLLVLSMAAALTSAVCNLQQHEDQQQQGQQQQQQDTAPPRLSLHQTAAVQRQQVLSLLELLSVHGVLAAAGATASPRVGQLVAAARPVCPQHKQQEERHC